MYKGTIYSVIPEKGCGFINPTWGDKAGTQNIVFRLKDTKHHCHLVCLQNKGELANKDKKTKDGKTIFMPLQEQVVYFDLRVTKIKGKYQLLAIDIRDSDHISAIDALEAAGITQKPKNIEYLKQPEKTEVSYSISEELVKSVSTTADKAEVIEAEEAKVVDNAVEETKVEETKVTETANYDDDYDDDYDDYEEEPEEDYSEYDDDSLYEDDSYSKGGSFKKNQY